MLSKGKELIWPRVKDKSLPGVRQNRQGQGIARLLPFVVDHLPILSRPEIG